jgi:methyltransferase (TIGR00027 family)
MAWVEQRSEESVLPIVLRTRFFDDYLRRIIADGAVRQIVLMAAGLDTRAFRLGFPEHVHVFELDRASVLRHKERILRAAKATCWRRNVEVDLTSAWETPLQKAGFDPRQPSGWLLEGFLFYLSTENLTRLLDRATRLASPGSYIGFDIINGLTLTSKLTKGWVEMQAKAGAPWIGTLDDPERFLADRNWKTSLTALGSPEANYDRWPYPVISSTAPGIPHLWLVVGEKEKTVEA